MTKITENLQLVRQRIDAAALAAGRDPEEIRLLAVSKTQSATAVLEASKAGQRHFGENYVQEALEKMERLAERDVRWHFIGRLQTNKTGSIARNFHWLHSLTRIDIAKRLSDQRPHGTRPLQVCIQVRIGDEASKAGVSEADVAQLADAVANLPGLDLRGLMCLPPVSTDQAIQRRNFAQLRHNLETLRANGHELDTLSMGMSADLEAAITEGSTCVRVGTALFGARR